jgi:uncharacterized protein YecE (DUF72 family)
VTGRILVGTASWTDRSLLDTGWYPKGTNTAEERLAYYASRFPLVEVDSTYYFAWPLDGTAACAIMVFDFVIMVG